MGIPFLPHLLSQLLVAEGLDHLVNIVVILFGIIAVSLFPHHRSRLLQLSLKRFVRIHYRNV